MNNNPLLASSNSNPSWIHLEKDPITSSCSSLMGRYLGVGTLCGNVSVYDLNWNEFLQSERVSSTGAVSWMSFWSASLLVMVTHDGSLFSFDWIERILTNFTPSKESFSLFSTHPNISSISYLYPFQNQSLLLGISDDFFEIFIFHFPGFSLVSKISLHSLFPAPNSCNQCPVLFPSSSSLSFIFPPENHPNSPFETDH
eukprot:Sdes_comp21733_c0_seq1m20302